MRVHVEQKSFLCELCGKGYKDIRNLDSHMIIHLHDVYPTLELNNGCLENTSESPRLDEIEMENEIPPNLVHLENSGLGNNFEFEQIDAPRNVQEVSITRGHNNFANGAIPPIQEQYQMTEQLLWRDSGSLVCQEYERDALYSASGSTLCNQEEMYATCGTYAVEELKIYEEAQAPNDELASSSELFGESIRLALEIMSPDSCDQGIPILNDVQQIADEITRSYLENQRFNRNSEESDEFLE
ncbi:hypothetical protein QAD02_009515 [Eretmocerus hayati]|uniref:Uncharacterized protein n=1 Tax=Eretmocerus hayati TaxID=131215 RepID=A0ACC2N9T8_9HYME|nr:hypothetical protein QAD02_009515 [Eretmocerus hayati]